MKKLILVLMSLICLPQAWANCTAFVYSKASSAGVMVQTTNTGTAYYIDPQSGLDSNNGTSQSTPWQHHPYEAGAPFSGQVYTHHAGDCFYFKGGTTIGSTNIGFGLVNGGSASAGNDYYGPDPTQSWFTGASWTRPIINQGGVLTAAQNNNVWWFQADFITVDNFEIKGQFWNEANATSTHPAVTFGVANHANITMSRNYVHGFVASNTSFDSSYLAYGNHQGSNTLVYNIVDGSDSNNPGHLFQGPQYCCAIIEHNIHHDVGNGYNTQCCNSFQESIAYNTLYNINGSADSANHSAIFEPDHAADIHDNVIHNSTIISIISTDNGGSDPSAVSRIYNNIWYNMNTGYIMNLGCNGGTCSSPGTASVYNNTIDCGGLSSCIRWSPSPETPIVANISNNHFINCSSPSTALANCLSGTNPATMNVSGNLIQTEAQANAAGYTSTQTFAYSPTVSGSPTVGAGANETSLCPTYLLCTDTEYGAVTVGNAPPTTPRNPNPRPASGAWDIGAYEFATVSCPISTSYINPANPGGPTVSLAASGVTTCYFISANGVDTNSGLSESSPWLHAPGMQGCSGNCSTLTLAAGQGFIFRGGDTWHYSGTGNTSGLTPGGLPWSWTQSGTSNNYVYIGVDKTWFTGASWTRPKMNFDNPTSSSSVSGCTYGTQFNTSPAFFDDSGVIGFKSSGNFVQLDNFEWTGFCTVVAQTISQFAPGGVVVSIVSGTHDIVSNNYFHGWTACVTGNNVAGSSCTSSSGPSNGVFPTMILGANGTSATSNSIMFNAVDGSDTFCTGVGNCEAWFDYGEGYDVGFNYVTKIGNGVNSPGNIFRIHDNIFDHIYQMGNGPHTGVIESENSTAGSPMYIYNNIFRFGNPGVGIWPEPGTSLYQFNNVDFQYRDGLGGTNCFLIDHSGNSAASTPVNFFNNTLDAPCTYTFNGGSTPFVGTATFTNNHFIGTYTTLSNFYIINSGSSPTIVDNDSHVFQTESVANGQGYTQSNNYSPTTGAGSTVNAGTNLTTLCSGITDSLAASACTNGIAGITYNSTNHSVTANSPTPRPASGAWNTGAYQFSGSAIPPANTPTFSPVAGAYTGSQSVTISTTSAGAVICYTSNGSTPATNTTTGCVLGSTLYTGPVPVSVSETLKAVAGGTGFTDSAVGLAAYTITTQAATPMFSPVAGTYVGPQAVQISTSSGTVLCYNTTGAPTIVSGACGTGSTLYTGPVTVPVGNETLFAIAGGTGFTNSTVASAAYVIHPATLWSSILDYSRATDWTQAGIPGGIPNRTVACNTQPSLVAGAGAASGNASAIQTAITSASAAGGNCVINIPSGTWYTNGFYASGNAGAVNNNVTIRGAGPNKTILLIQSVVSCFTKADICLGGNGNGYGKYNGTAAWLGDNTVAGSYNQGDTVITLAGWTGSTPVQGDLITLDQRDDEIGLCPSSGGTGNCTGNQGATESGTTVTLTTSLPHGYAVGNSIYVGGVSHPSPANGALGGQLFQGLTYPSNMTCTGGVVTVTDPIIFDVLGPKTVTITGGTWANGIESLTLSANNPFASHVNGIRAVAISGTGTSLDGNTYIIDYTSTSASLNLIVASQPATQPTAGTGTSAGDTVWISGSNGIFSGVQTVTGTGSGTFTYNATCSGSFSAGNYILDPISYTGLWTITDVGCNVSGTYTTSASCGANPINALRYTSPVSGLPASGGGQVSVDTGGFYVTCVGGSNCASQSGSGWPGANARSCPFTNFGTGGTSVCAVGEYSYREQREVHVITNVSGNNYTISPPIYSTNWRTSQNPGAMFLGTGAYATGLGLEGLTVDGTNDAGNTSTGLVVLLDCYQCWVKNVRSISGHRNHIWLPAASFQDEVVDSYMWGSPGAAKSYGVENDSSSNLIQNNICQHVVTCMMTSGTIGSVIAYNYAFDTGEAPSTDNIALVNVNHSFDFYSLFEGNDFNTVTLDTAHGQSTANTIMRNRIAGQDFPPRVNYLRPVENVSFNRAVNYVGNILGTAGLQTSYQSNLNSSSNNSNIYIMAAWSNDGTLQDGTLTSTILRWNNYDTASAVVRTCGNASSPGFSNPATCNSVSEIPTTGVTFINGNAVPASTTLPASFYLSNQPLFWTTTWGTPAFPAIGPDVTASGSLDTTCTPASNSCDGVGHYSYQIPAQICYNNTTVDPAYQQTFSVTAATWNSANGQATLTIGANTFIASDTVVVSGIAPPGFNGTFPLSSVSIAPGNTVNYAVANPGSATGSGGTLKGPNILLYNASSCYTQAYPQSMPAPSSVVFTKNWDDIDPEFIERTPVDLSKLSFPNDGWSIKDWVNMVYDVPSTRALNISLPKEIGN